MQEPDTTLYRPALETLRTLIRTSTSSMTSVPKPLKFLRPHYYELETIYNKWPTSDDKVSFHLVQYLRVANGPSAHRASLRTFSVCWL
jgi:26S proteasome regulatory subunit N1